MKLTGTLKEEVSKAQSKDEARDILEKAGMSLTDDELDMVAGGGSIHFGEKRSGVGTLPSGTPLPEYASEVEKKKIRDSGVYN